MSMDITIPRIGLPDTVTGVVTPSTRGRTETRYSVTTSYRNLLGYPICIVDRNNIIATIPSNSFGRNATELIIEYRLNFSDNVNLNWDTVLNESSGVPLIEAIKAVSKSTEVQVITNGHEIIVEYTITHRNLASKGYALYIDQLDIVVAKSDRAHNSVHPYSTVGQSILALDEGINLTGFYYQVIINDPYDDFGERYLNINGSVFRARRTKDRSNRPGVYINAKDKCEVDSSNSSNYDTTFYSFDDADKEIPMYGTAHLALSLGDAFYIKEQEVKTRDSEVKKNLADLAIKKIELDTKLKEMEFQHKKEVMTLESENARLKDEVDREKTKREQVTAHDKFQYERKSREDKDTYEMRSLIRKDVNEFVKWLPGILGGILAAANIILAIQKSKT